MILKDDWDRKKRVWWRGECHFTEAENKWKIISRKLKILLRKISDYWRIINNGILDDVGK